MVQSTIQPKDENQNWQIILKTFKEAFSYSHQTR